MDYKSVCLSQYIQTILQIKNLTIYYTLQDFYKYINFYYIVTNYVKVFVYVSETLEFIR